MTKEDIIKKLTEELEDELEGICEYDKTYDSLVSLGYKKEAERIERIAGEEYYHAKILMDILETMGVELNTKIHNDWARVKKIFAIE